MDYKPNNRRTFFVLAAGILLVILLALLITNLSGNKVEVISYDRLVTEIKEGKVAGIYFTGSYTVNVLYASETDEKNIENFKSGKFANASCVVKYRDDFTETIENYQNNQDNADFTLPYIWLNDPNANSFRSYIFPVLSLLLLAGLAIYMIVTLRKQGGGMGGAMNFGKTKST